MSGPAYKPFVFDPPPSFGPVVSGPTSRPCFSGPVSKPHDFTGVSFESPLSLKEFGGAGGLHDTLICSPSGLVELHSTVECGGRNIMRDTVLGQTRLTDFFDPCTGKVFR